MLTECACALLAAGLSVAASSQENAVSLAGRALEQALAILEQQGGLRIFYSSDLVRPWMRVEGEPAGSEAGAMLDAVLAPHGLRTRPGPQGSLLIVRDTSAAAAPRPAPASAAAPSSTGAPAPDSATALEEIVVAASGYELRRPVSASTAHFGSRDLEQLPDLGEDAIRAVARLPGTASNGFSARPSIRGGALDETLVRLDGLRLYDPFHLKDFQGVFSVIDPRVVDSMDLLTGGFPAAFGDRLSGVIDIETITPGDALHHELGVSFFNSSLLSSGRFDQRRGTWLASLRRSNLDLLYDYFSDRPERPRYADAFAKLSYQIGEALRITGYVLRSEDDIHLADDFDREELAEARHSDRYAWLALEHVLSDRVSGTTTLGQGALDSRRVGETSKDGISTGELTDFRAFTIETLASDWSWRLTDGLLLQLGGNAQRVAGSYAYDDEVAFDLLFDVAGAPTEVSRARSIRTEPTGRTYSVYANLRYRIGGRSTAELGLRWDEQTLEDEADATIDPRVGFRYRVTDRIDVRASWGRVHQSQAVHELAVGDGETAYAAPQGARHFGVGLEYFFDGGTRLRLDLYDKRMSDLRARYENLLNSQVLLPELKPDRIRLAPETARARGLELMLDSRPGPMQWWFGYTWSRVEERFENEITLRSWDQTHALTAGWIWDRPKWNASLALSFRSGWPTTPVVLDANGEFPVVRASEPRNSDRLGGYRTVDLRLTRKIGLRRSSLAFSLELTNLFDRANPCCVEYEIDDADLLELSSLEYLPSIPSLGVLWRF